MADNRPIYHSQSAPAGRLPLSTYGEHQPIAAPSLADFRSQSYPSDSQPFGAGQIVPTMTAYSQMSPPPSPSKKRERDEVYMQLPAASTSSLISPTSTVFDHDNIPDDEDFDPDEEDGPMEEGENAFRLNARLKTQTSRGHLRNISSSSSLRDNALEDDYVDGKRPKKARTPSAGAQQRVTDLNDDDDGKVNGRRKIQIEYIQDKSRRHITFSKRKAGIMKKAYELSTLTGTQVLLLVVSETGTVYTYSTSKLQPLVTETAGKNLIRECLDSEDSGYINNGAEPKGGHVALKAKAPSRKSSTNNLRTRKSTQDLGSPLQNMPITSPTPMHNLTMQDLPQHLHPQISETMYQHPIQAPSHLSMNPQNVYMGNTSAQIMYSHAQQQLAQTQIQRAVTNMAPQHVYQPPSSYMNQNEAYL